MRFKGGVFWGMQVTYTPLDIALCEVSRSRFLQNCIENVDFLLMIAKRHETVLLTYSNYLEVIL